MADKIFPVGDNQVFYKYKDMNDGTHAEVIVLGQSITPGAATRQEVTYFEALVAFTGAAQGDRLEKTDTIDNTTGSITASVWRNQTQGNAIIAAPSLSDVIQLNAELAQEATAQAALQQQQQQTATLNAIATSLTDAATNAAVGVLGKETTQQQVLAALTSLLAAQQAAKDFETTLWVDNSTTPPTYYSRREVLNEVDGTFTVAFYNQAGVQTPYQSSWLPVERSGDVGAVSNLMEVTAGDPVYAAGTMLTQLIIVTSDGTTHTSWRDSTGEQVAAPTNYEAVTENSTRWISLNSYLSNLQGAPGTGISQPTGGSGLFGWLSGVYQKVTGMLSALTDGTQKTQVSNFPATQAVSAAALPLPTGAATEQAVNQVEVEVQAANQILDQIKTAQTDGTQKTEVTNFPATQAVSGTVAVSTTQRTATLTSATSSGTVAAGAFSVSFTAMSGTVTVAGTALPVGASISWSAPLGDTLGAIAYTVATGEVVISKVA